MNEKAFEKVERDLNLATGEIKIMGAKDRHFSPFIYYSSSWRANHSLSG